MKRLIAPREALITIDLSKGHPSDYLRAMRSFREDGITDAARFLMGLEAAGKSNYLAKRVINHFDGKSSTSSVTPIYLALCTVVPESSKTGTTITEAGYTGYARKKIEAASMGEPAESSGAEAKSAEVLTFAECTASSSTVIGWALCDASTVGNMLWWGTTTSVVISTSQTPATIAKEVLVLKEA